MQVRFDGFWGRRGFEHRHRPQNVQKRERNFHWATDGINRITTFKRTPVREGSQPYYQCLEASKVIQEVEAGAAELKVEKTRLEAVIREMER